MTGYNRWLRPSRATNDMDGLKATGDEVYERIRDPKWLSGGHSPPSARRTRASCADSSAETCALAGAGDGDGEWSSGLCDCMTDCRKCLISLIPIVNTFDVAYTFNVINSKDGLTGEPCCGIVLPTASICSGTCALLSCIQVFSCHLQCK